MTEQIKLSPKKQVFVESYLKCWNASEAARDAGYKFPGRAGWKLIHQDEKIQAAISQRISEIAMSADEVLLRLAEQARTNVGEFVLFAGKEVIEIDWDKVYEKGHLVKKIIATVNGPSVELHDAQAALIHLGRHHGLFVDRVEADVNTHIKGYETVSPDDWDEDTQEDEET